MLTITKSNTRSENDKDSLLIQHEAAIIEGILAVLMFMPGTRMLA
ncbi:MAG: hypothetical protein ABFC57_17310 [Veillonellales bacterium]